VDTDREKGPALVAGTVDGVGIAGPAGIVDIVDRVDIEAVEEVRSSLLPCDLDI
jgi:hypothetical protein